MSLLTECYDFKCKVHVHMFSSPKLLKEFHDIL